MWRPYRLWCHNRHVYGLRIYTQSCTACIYEHVQRRDGWNRCKQNNSHEHLSFRKQSCRSIIVTLQGTSAAFIANIWNIRKASYRTTTPVIIEYCVRLWCLFEDRVENRHELCVRLNGMLSMRGATESYQVKSSHPMQHICTSAISRKHMP